MTFAQLQARATLLASLEGWTDIIPAPDWASLVNQAWVQFSWDGEFNIISEDVSTIIGQAGYVLTGQFKRILDCTYDPGGGGTKTGLLHSTEDIERFARADWRIQANGTPLRYTFNPFNALTLVPPPVAVGKTVNVRGASEAAVLVSPGDIPNIPTNLHEAIALKAAVFLGEVYSQGEASTRLAGYEARYQKYVSDALAYAAPVAEGN